MRRSAARGTSHSLAIRPGRDDSSRTRWPSRTASRTLWVTKTIVRPVSRQTRSSSSCSRSRVIASSAANGSSISSSWRSWPSARASATRWRMPPESSCGRFSAASAGRPASSSSAPRRAARRVGTPRSLQRELDVAARGEPRAGAPAPGTSARRRPPATSRLPAVGSLEPGDDVEQRGLAAAGGAEEADEFARRMRERRRRRARPARRREALAEASDLGLRSRPAIATSRPQFAGRDRRSACLGEHGVQPERSNRPSRSPGLGGAGLDSCLQEHGEGAASGSVVKLSIPARGRSRRPAGPFRCRRRAWR